jgi:hypothetical protein
LLPQTTQEQSRFFEKEREPERNGRTISAAGRSPVLALDLSDQSRLTTFDAALERNPFTTSATATKRVHRPSEAHGGKQMAKPWAIIPRWLTHSGDTRTRRRGRGRRGGARPPAPPPPRRGRLSLSLPWPPLDPASNPGKKRGEPRGSGRFRRRGWRPSGRSERRGEEGSAG